MAQSGAALMLSLLASLALFADAFAPPKPSEWHVCALDRRRGGFALRDLTRGSSNKRANYDVVVTNVTIKPDPVVSGEKMTFTVPAYTEFLQQCLAEKELTKGIVVASVSFHGITVHSERIDLCHKVQCPVVPGDFALTNTQVLPGISPPGSYRIRLQFLGEEGEQLACTNINFSIVWKKSVAETLKSFNPIGLHKNEREAPLVAHS